jgi:hypothetical protein
VIVITVDVLVVPVVVARKLANLDGVLHEKADSYLLLRHHVP